MQVALLLWMGVMRKGKKRCKSHSAIDDHRRVGTTLVPPMLQIRGLTLCSWINDRLPEVVWVGLLLRELPRIPVLNAIREIGDVIHKIGPAASDLTLSGLASNEVARDEVMTALCRSENWRRALAPLLLFEQLPNRELWAKHLPEPEPTTGWAALAGAVASMLDHQSESATDARWVRIVGPIAAGLVTLTREDQIPIFENITAYPHAGDLRAVRPTIRSMEGALTLSESPKPWPKEFWRASLAATSCFALPAKPEHDFVPPVTTAAHARDVYHALVQRCHVTRSTSAVDSRHDGVFSIALYAVAAFLEILQIERSTTIMSRLVLRTLLEAAITIRYLESNGSAELWSKFRAYGAGQAKLSFLKLDEAKEKPTSVSVSVLEALATEDAWLEFVSVDLGHWAKKDLRRMAEDAGLKDLYDRFYPWTSAYAHSQWQATRDVVFDTCGNPLHRLHRIPRAAPRSLPDAVSDAALLVDLILDSVERQFPAPMALLRIGRNSH